MFELGDLDEKLGGDRRVAVKVGAEWCTMCDDLDEQVLATPAGRAIFEGLDTVGVDFDASPDIGQRLAILELPTVVILRPDGVEAGRIVGFADVDGWLAEAREAIASDDPIPALREAAEKGEPQAMLRLGELLLSREPEEATQWLERASWSDEVGTRAIWLLGRWHHRVRRDPATARFLWQQLAYRAPTGKQDGALWWYAKAQAELGHVDAGSRAYEAWLAEHPEQGEAILDWARFAIAHRYDPARAPIRRACEQALRTARGEERDRLEFLVMDLSRPFA
ncbi:MAG: hypothetical protein KC619_17280 [Myxococcales bacterium]|nr:hypothetical protein [Myxococcales bacterium]